MDYKEFSKKVRVYFNAHLSHKYCKVEVDELCQGDVLASFSRIEPQTGRQVTTCQILHSHGVFEVSETFGDGEAEDGGWSNIPDSYGLKPREDMPGQTPMFVYGTYVRLGDALNSIAREGDSLDGRKYSELFW